ncbi:radical SAM protein [bacterium]|nr:radical SAM protein [bacterium]
MFLKSLMQSRLPLRSYVKGFLPFLNGFVSLLANRPNSFSPLICKIIPTYRCNCHCLYCNLEKRIEEGRELNTKEMIDLAKQIGKSKIWMVHLTGGEPLFKKDIWKIIKVLKDYNKIVYIGTNGILLEKCIDVVLRYNIDFLGISFDSHIPAKHNFMLKFDNAFEKTLKGIEAIKKKRKGRYPIINIKGMIHRLNFRELESYIEFFKKLGDNIILQPIQNNLVHLVRDKSLLFKRKDEEELRMVFDNLMKKYNFLNNDYYRLMPDFIFNPERLLKENRFRCLFFPSFELTIQPWGEVTLCRGRKDAVIGNIRKSKLLDLWKGKRTFEIQKMLRNPENNCICWIASNTRLNQYLMKIPLLK